MSTGSNLPFPPYKTKITDAKGIMTAEWQKWFQQLYVRTGGAIAVPNIPGSQVPSLLVASYVGTINQTIYTSPTGQNTIIDVFQVTNTDTASQSLSVYLVPVNGTPDSSNISVNGAVITAGATVKLQAPQDQVLGGGAYIVCVASSVNALAVAVTGRRVS